jgi:cytochrome c oxidase cbb3-type subunit 2
VALLRNSLLGVGAVAASLAIAPAARAQSLRPHIMFVFDTSGSMLDNASGNSVGEGTNICGTGTTTSRLYGLKSGIRAALAQAGTDEANFGLMSFPTVVVTNPNTSSWCGGGNPEVYGHYRAANSRTAVATPNRTMTTYHGATDYPAGCLITSNSTEATYGTWFSTGASEVLRVGVTSAAPGSVPTAAQYDPPDANIAAIYRWIDNVELPTTSAAVTDPELHGNGYTPLGRSLFQQRCAGCHGERGDGLGPHAARLPIRPTNFNLGVYKLRSTPTGSIPTDRDLFMTVTRGVHGTPMLPWKALSEEERWALVYQLKSLSVRFREERPARPITVPAPPKEDRPLRERGAALYRKLLCAHCHGEEGAGDGVAARVYERTDDRQVRVRDFTRGRFIRGAEMQDLYLTLRTGLEGTPMGAYDTLRDDEVWALAAYVRSLVRERPLHELPPARTHARADDGHSPPR